MPTVLQSTRLPSIYVVILMPDWPPRAWCVLGEFVCIADAGCRGQNLIRARRAIATIATA